MLKYYMGIIFLELSLIQRIMKNEVQFAKIFITTLQWQLMLPFCILHNLAYFVAQVCLPLQCLLTPSDAEVHMPNF